MQICSGTENLHNSLLLLCNLLIHNGLRLLGGVVISEDGMSWVSV